MAETTNHWRAALENAGGDRDLLIELAAMFADDCPHRFAAARAALERGDAATLEREAHTLKGRLAFFALEAPRAEAARVERLGRLNDLAAAGKALEALERELATRLPEFRDLSGLL